MAEIKFVIKGLIVTFLLISFLQIKVGDQSLETQAYHMLAQSKLTSFLNDFARKAIHLAKEAQNYFDSHDSAIR